MVLTVTANWIAALLRRSLKRKLAKDSELHRSDNLRIMQVRGHIGVQQKWGGERRGPMARNRPKAIAGNGSRTQGHGPPHVGPVEASCSGVERFPHSRWALCPPRPSRPRLLWLLRHHVAGPQRNFIPGAALQENTALIKEINELRREIKALKGGLSAAGATAGAPGAKGATRGSAAGRASPDVDLRREMDMQRELIARLREDVSGAGGQLGCA